MDVRIGRLVGRIYCLAVDNDEVFDEVVDISRAELSRGLMGRKERKRILYEGDETKLMA